MMSVLSSVGAKALSFLSPVVDLLKAFKQQLLILLAFKAGQKKGRKDVIHETTEKEFDNMADVRDALNDPDKRMRADEEYGNHK